MKISKLRDNLENGTLYSLKESKSILWFDEIGISDIPFVGGKNASLGEMYQNLTKLGVKIPFGFAVTSYAYNLFLEENNLKDKIKKTLLNLDTQDLSQLAKKGKEIRELIIGSTFPAILEKQIIKAYEKLEKRYGKFVDVAVRSSATAEDLPDASFAGQQETYLNVHSTAQLIYNCKLCFASLFTNRAISYRQDKGFSHFDVSLSIGVQKMVRSDKGSSGVMFSIDTESGFNKVSIITSAYGLGENVVQGAVNPDEFVVFKPTIDEGYNAIISKRIGEKEIKMVYDEVGHKLTKNIQVSKEDREKFSLNDDEIVKLGKWSIIIENHYSKVKGHYQPMDMEWAKDGITNQLYIVQARPETVQSRKNYNVIETYSLTKQSKKLETLTKGVSVGDKIATGKVRIIDNISQAGNFQKGDILVTDITDPDWEPIMKKANAIITNRGGRTCHAAIISREMGVPAVVGCMDATTSLKNGDLITIDCSKGEKGVIYKGHLDYKISKVKLDNIPKTRTKMMLNIGNPHLAFKNSFLPNDGVGLAREEFIVNESIKIHPNALIYFDYLKTKKEAQNDVKKIEEITKGYSNKIDFYVDKLAEGIATIGAAFYPKKVIMRLSDFKSNEYSNLIGGSFFEPKEENPMIGFRGSRRYYSKEFIEAFKLELLAIKKVNEVFGLTNVKIMIPFCRTVEELDKVLKIINSHGIKRGKRNMEIYLMCEIPSNIILAEEFLKKVDGYSIGSNDLTQLTLGVDRDSELCSNIFDERNKAMLDILITVINKCKKLGKYIGICGQGPSDHEDFAKFLVENKIESMSLNPDSIVKTILNTNEIENNLTKKRNVLNGFSIENSKVKIENVDKKVKKKVVKKDTIKKPTIKKKVEVKKTPIKKVVKKVVKNIKQKQTIKKTPIKKKVEVKKTPIKKVVKKDTIKKKLNKKQITQKNIKKTSQKKKNQIKKAVKKK